jgi:hypothetical protein
MIVISDRTSGKKPGNILARSRFSKGARKYRQLEKFPFSQADSLAKSFLQARTIIPESALDLFSRCGISSCDGMASMLMGLLSLYRAL